jgi:hypothetical protein
VWESIGHVREPVEPANHGFEPVGAVPQGLGVGLFCGTSLGESEETYADFVE